MALNPPAVEIRKSFHQSLDEVSHDIVRLAGMVTESLGKATEALLDGDLRVAEEIIAGEVALDALTLDIEERCYQLLTLQQPMARDLRSVVTAARLAAEIQRSGGLVVNIMKAARRLYGVELDPRLRGLIERLGEQVHRLFRLSIDAYVERDDSLAAAMDDMDDTVDDLHVDYIQAIFEAHGEGVTALKVAVQLALVGRFYERIGDHAVNIGERVQYMVTGWLPEHDAAARQRVRGAGEPPRATGDATSNGAGSDRSEPGPA
ncbi:MAG: phosphate signaling complex protein PhoU [Actinomycetota bacterium]|jgi:phosphate transport system protein|nr:phosphate signaling complex protein PhoU [Actinomycetota bacterium]